MRRYKTAAVLGAAVMTAGFAIAATSSSVELAGASDNLELITSIEGPGGTDIEFFSAEVPEVELADGSTRAAKPGEVRHFAFQGNQQSGAKIIDITEPETPYVVADMGEQDCIVGQGDIQINADATLAAIAFQTGGACEIVTPDGVKRARLGSILVDITDPYNPVPVGNAEDPDGSHNHTLHPTAPYLYISTSTITEGQARVPIYDISDPANPELIQIWSTPGNSPHDIRFSPEGDRAYMAGVSQYRIVDTSDPENPALISVITPPGGSIGHDTLITPDGRYLFLGDEAGGGATFPCPGGAVYVYDLMNEATPILLGAVEADGGPVTNRQFDEAGPGAPGACTAHVMDLNPDGMSFTLGWYTLGARVFDFSALYDAEGTPTPGPALAYGQGVGVVQTHWINPEGANTWSAKQYSEVPGYIFGDDLNLGFYVAKILDHEVHAG